MVYCNASSVKLQYIPATKDSKDVIIILLDLLVNALLVGT